MLIVTTNEIPGYRITRVHGDVFGLTARSSSLCDPRIDHRRPAVVDSLPSSSGISLHPASGQRRRSRREATVRDEVREPMATERPTVTVGGQDQSSFFLAK